MTGWPVLESEDELGVDLAVSPQPATNLTSLKSALLEGNRNVFPGIYLLKLQPQLTTNGYY